MNTGSKTGRSGELLTVQQLRYFVALAQHLHFGIAAKACFVSQPALSHGISELEVELNCRLLYRDTRSVTLTPAGKAFYNETHDIIKCLDEAIAKAKKAESGYSGSFHIGALSGLSVDAFLSKILPFKLRYPDIDVNLTQPNMKMLNMGLLKGSLDIVLTRKCDIVSRSDELQWRTLYQDRFGILFHADSPLAKIENVHLADLANEPFVFFDPLVTPNVYDYVMRLCMARGLVPKTAYPAPALEFVCTLVKAGMGIAVVPGRDYGDKLVFRPFEGDDALSAVVLAWKKRNMNPIIPIFLSEFDIDMAPTGD